MVEWGPHPVEMYSRPNNLEDILNFTEANQDKMHKYVTRAEQVFGNAYQTMRSTFHGAYQQSTGYLKMFYDYVGRLVENRAEKLLNVIDYLMGQVGPVNVIEVDKDVMGRNLLGMTFPNVKVPPIFLNKGQGLLDKLETTVHELCHIKHPELSEGEIRKLTEVYCNI